VHEEEVDISGVVDEESLVAGGHHVASLPVRSKANLNILSALILDYAQNSTVTSKVTSYSPSEATQNWVANTTYRWHNHLTLESSSDTVVDTLGLSPAGVDTFVGVWKNEKLGYFTEDVRLKNLPDWCL
jgi:hypothetical protein